MTLILSSLTQPLQTYKEVSGIYEDTHLDNRNDAYEAIYLTFFDPRFTETIIPKKDVVCIQVVMEKETEGVIS